MENLFLMGNYIMEIKSKYISIFGHITHSVLEDVFYLDGEYNND